MKSKDRMALWAHLVSEHCAIIQPTAKPKELRELHAHEHHGPGGIRNHPEDSRDYSLKKMGKVLSEVESV